MNWKNEWRKLRRFLALALLTETGLMALVALGVQSTGEWSWHNFSVGLGIAGAAALVLGMYSLVGSGKSFEMLNRVLQQPTHPSGTENSGQTSPFFLLIMVFAGSVAIGVGQYLGRLF